MPSEKGTKSIGRYYDPTPKEKRERRRKMLGDPPKKANQPQQAIKQTYNAYLTSKAWIKKRRRILNRDEWKCVYCHAPAVAVHHVQYPKRMGDEDPRMLQSVCQRCHTLAHGGTPPTAAPPSETTATAGNERRQTVDN